MVGLLLLLFLMTAIVVALWLAWQARAEEHARATAAEERVLDTEGVAHDVNNLLGAVALSLGGVGEFVRADPAAADALLGESLKSLEVAAQLNRSVSHGVEVDGSTRCAFETVVRLYVRRARKAGTIHLHVTGDLPPPGDAESAGRIVQNLLSNALSEAREAGGGVHVHLDDAALRIRNRVRDPALLTDRVHGRDVSDVRGASLGLTLCHQLARDLGWELTHEVEGDEVSFLLREAPRAAPSAG